MAVDIYGSESGVDVEDLAGEFQLCISGCLQMFMQFCLHPWQLDTPRLPDNYHWPWVSCHRTAWIWDICCSFSTGLLPSCQTPTQNQTTTALTFITVDYFYLFLNFTCILLCGTSFAGHNVSEIWPTGHSWSVSVKILASWKEVLENVRGV